MKKAFLMSLSSSVEGIEGRRTETDTAILPETATELDAWDEDATPVALLAQTEDAALYGLAGEEDRVLLRWGDALAEFDWAYRTPRRVQPELYQLDADGDGETELAALCYCGSGTGVSVYDLYIVEKTGDGLTSYRLPAELLSALSNAIRVETAEGRTFAVLGREMLELTHLLDPGAAPPEGLVAGDIVEYDVLPGRYPAIRFRGSAWLDGEGYPPTVWYGADLSADVIFESGTFILDGLHLDGNGA